MKNEFYKLAEASEDISKLQGINCIEDKINKNVAVEIFSEIADARNCMNTFVDSFENEKISFKTLQVFRRRIEVLIALLDFLVEIERKNHAANVINDSEHFAFNNIRRRVPVWKLLSIDMFLYILLIFSTFHFYRYVFLKANIL